MFSTDSRKIKHGDVFLAINCDSVLQNIGHAIQNGASRVITDQTLQNLIQEKYGNDNRFTFVYSTRMHISELYRRKYNKQPNTLVAVTGTNGKTSVAKFLENIWHYCGYRSGSIGTLGVSCNNTVVEETINTTPGADSFYEILQNMANNHVTKAVFEASSHGIDQYRFQCANIAAAAITNITEDHYRYHKDFETYKNTKLKLISSIDEDGYAVIPRDDEALYQYISSNAHTRIITFGYNKYSDVYASDVHYNNGKLCFDINFNCYGNIKESIQLQIIGEYQINNILCACALACVTGCKTKSIIESLGALKTIPGRLDLIATYNEAQIFVDYAHNGDGMQKCLSSLRNICNGRLICVFGVSDKDYLIRSGQMGQHASTYCDYVVVTDDNLYNTTLRQTICDKICNELEHDKYTICHNRRDAINLAIDMLKPGDILVVTGRGHETTMIHGDEETNISDVETIKQKCNPAN